MNKVVEVIKKGSEICFIIKTKGESKFWRWEIKKSIYDEYKEMNIFATPDMFVNDKANSSYGFSYAYFDSVMEAVANYCEFEIVKF